MAKGKQLRRRSHMALKSLSLTPCSHCKKEIPSHIVCKFCGYYNSREVINVLAKELKKKEKMKQRATS